MDAGMVEARKEGSTGVVGGDEGTRNVLYHSTNLTGVLICGDGWIIPVVLLSYAVNRVSSHLLVSWLVVFKHFLFHFRDSGSAGWCEEWERARGCGCGFK